ncbi:MAG: copper homeostasis protein CutC [Candidatus Sulfotelmatobacter sp.]
MPNRLVLEICVESVDHAVAAERGGAHRIELCTDLSSGGVTPSAALMQTARHQVRIPIHALIRPRAGNFCYSNDELEIMRHDIRAAKQLGMDGVVLGVLQENARVDIERTKALVELAHPLPVTFHRAFDASHNLETSLQDVIQTGASRILTSAGQPRATDGLQTLARLVQAAGERILIMPCGGINSDNVLDIVRTTLAQEVHSSAGASNPTSAGNGGDLSEGNNEAASDLQASLFEQKVAKLVSLLGGVSHHEPVR